MQQFKTIFFLLSLVLGASSVSAYYDELPEVVDLANAGDYVLLENSGKCPARFQAKDEKDQLGVGASSLCVKSFELPHEVAFEVDVMAENELENESDYDQRITSLLAFRWNRVSSAGVKLKDLKKLAKALKIPKSQLVDMHMSSEVADSSTFERFDHLFLGLEFKNNSKTQEYLVNLFKGSLVQIISFEDGVELYPGGGFYVTHYFFIANGKAVYVKLSWWNS